MNNSISRRDALKFFTLSSVAAVTAVAITNSASANTANAAPIAIRKGKHLELVLGRYSTSRAYDLPDLLVFTNPGTEAIAERVKVRLFARQLSNTGLIENDEASIPQIITPHLNGSKKNNGVWEFNVPLNIAPGTRTAVQLNWDGSPEGRFQLLATAIVPDGLADYYEAQSQELVYGRASHIDLPVFDGVPLAAKPSKPAPAPVAPAPAAPSSPAPSSPAPTPATQDPTPKPGTPAPTKPRGQKSDGTEEYFHVNIPWL